jgi:hypothetical protein
MFSWAGMVAAAITKETRYIYDTFFFHFKKIRLTNLGRPGGHGGLLFVGPRFPI